MGLHISEFRAIPVFQGLNEEELRSIAWCVRRVSAPPGELLFDAGDTSNGAYIIRSGQVDVEFVFPDGGTRLLARLHPGRMVGELSLIDSSPRHLRARVWMMAELLLIDKDRFDELRRRHDPAAHKVIRNIALVVCERLRDTNERLQEGMAPVAERTEEAPLPPPRTGRHQSAWARLRGLLVGRD